ncbi:MAG: C40 family peptidase [Desulfobaccales bacterium]
MASLRSPPRPFDRLPRLTSPLHIVSPPSAQLSIRSEPETLPDRILTLARHYLGTLYRWGGSLQTGHTTDCSGFVQFIYKKFSIALPRSSPEQARVGMIVAKILDFAKMLPGDLLFFGHRGRHIGHVGIYLGDGKMIHASSRRRGVIITDLRQTFHEGAFVVAKRLFELQYPQIVSIRKLLQIPPFGKGGL